MKKRFISLALAGLMILALLPMLVGAADGESTEKAALILSTKNSQVAIKDGTTKGQTATVEVHLDKNPGIVSATIPVVWDTSALKLKAVISGNDCVIPTGWCGAEIPEEGLTTNKYYLAWNNDTICNYDKDGNPTEKNYTATGKLCTLVFEVLEEIAIDKPIPALTIQPGEDKKLFTIMSWGMDDYVNDGIADVTINDDGTISAVEKGEGVPGDVNGDEVFDLDDVFYLLYHSLFPNKYPLEGFDKDINGDNSFDLDDVFYLLYHNLFPSKYPLG